MMHLTRTDRQAPELPGIPRYVWPSFRLRSAAEGGTCRGSAGLVDQSVHLASEPHRVRTKFPKSLVAWMERSGFKVLSIERRQRELEQALAGGHAVREAER